jgi:acetylornithine deacetylase
MPASAEVIALLRALVRIPSVNPREGGGGGEAELAGFVRDWLAGRGIAAELHEVLPGRPNVVAVVPGRDPRAVLLEAHLDTVETEGMTVEPHAGEVRGGRLYGRGACDAKGSLAAFMLAAAELANDRPPPYTVVLAGVVDEEHLYRGVLNLLDTLTGTGAVGTPLDPLTGTGAVGTPLDPLEGRRTMSTPLDTLTGTGAVSTPIGSPARTPVVGALVGEPTGLVPVSAHKGVVRYTVRTLGEAGHSSSPGDAVNAISLMSRVLTHIEAAAPGVPDHPLLGPATRCLTRIRGGTGPNTVPGRCEIDVDRRTLPGEDPLEVWRRDRDELVALLPGRVEVDAPFTVDYALDTPTEGLLIAGLRRVLAEHGRESAVGGMPFCTDASKIARAGVPAVVFGPGSVADAHSAAESVALADVELAATLVTETVRRIGPIA